MDNSKSQGNSEWDTNGGSNTQDKVFLLSYAEVREYFGVTWENSGIKPRTSPTAYAIQMGANKDDNYKTADGSASGWWWLRSPGYYQSNAEGVRTDGSLNFNSYVSYVGGCVRPA